jgi:intracellular septation protein
MTKHSSSLKNIFEYLPLIIFFIIYKTQHSIYLATISLIVATIISSAMIFFTSKKLPIVSLFSAFIVAIFGGLTIIFDNDIFIKLKPTIINLIFATILIYGHLTKKPLLSYLLGEQIKISDDAWIKLSHRFAIFFLLLAILNEIIWRNFTTEFWVNFKVFGMMTISFIFTISQAGFIISENKKITNNVQ